MTTIKATISGVEITLEISGQLTSGMVGVPVSFEFDSAWDGLSKTAVFRAGKICKDRVNVGAETTVPWEVLRQESYGLQIGVYGCNADGTVVIPTIWADAGLIQPGADPSGDPGADPTLPVWQQTQNLANEALTVANSVRDDADRGMFQGEKGEKGDTGDPGPQGVQGNEGKPGRNGADGYTPQKGIDYYTEADKAEMVNAVIAALPTYNGEVVAV